MLQKGHSVEQSSYISYSTLKATRIELAILNASYFERRLALF